MSISDRLRRELVSQFHHPRGALGRLAGLILARRPSNVQRNLWTVDLLDPKPGERVLELGFGPGVGIEACARRVGDGCVVGIDHSETMLGVARRRNADAVRAGRVRLHCASFDALPPTEEPFDAIMAVNAVMFASDEQELLRELWARLRPGGRIAITFQSRRAGATSADSERGGAELAERLRKTGFEEPRTETLPLEPVSAVCVLARRSGAPGPGSPRT